jgi:hypothetical protein
MYVVQTEACSVPNSSTPVSPAQIQASQNVLAKMAAWIDQANQNMNAVITRPDLNAAGMPLAKVGGGSKQNPGMILPFDNSPIPPLASNPTRLRSWPTMCVGNGNPINVPTPLESTVPVKPAPMPPLTIPPVGVPAPAPAPGPKKVSMPTTGNVCIDLQRGFTLQQQVSLKQLIDCANKGYPTMGVESRLTPEQQAWQNANFANLPKVADQPNVPPYDPKMGLAGIPSTGLPAAVFWGSIGLGAAVLWLAGEYAKGGRRRR